MLFDTITYENTHTIQELMDHSVAAYADRDILRYEREDVIYHVTYSQFEEMSRKIGQFLNARRKTLGRPLHVGVIGEGSVNYIVALMGTMGSGNVSVPLDHQLDLTNLADSLNRADVDILFYDWTHEPLVRDVKPMCQNVSDYFSLQQVQEAPDISNILEDAAYDGKSWAQDDGTEVPKPDDLAMILFTSGTTGKSKGVMLTHQNLAGNALSQSPIENDEFDEIVSVLILPMHHVFCINIDILAMLYRGGTTCINGPISLLGKHLHMFEPTVLHIVPMIPKVLYNKIRAMVSADPGLTEKDAMRLIYGRRLGRIICGGGGLPEALAQKYLQMGIRIGQGYGMSECSPVISEPDFEHPEKVCSAGKVLDHIDIRIADSGEVQVRSPFVMKGYYGDPELTKETFTEDGWLKTGDVGYLDDEGFLYLTGRIKNLIILSNGENVAPEEIEADFSTEPLVRDIVVFEEDDMIKCEVHPDFAYAEKAGIQDILEEIKAVVNRHNQNFPPFKRILQTSIRKAPFQKTTSNKIIRAAFMAERSRTQNAGKGSALPTDEKKRSIFEICSHVLGHKDFGLGDNLYTVGLDSFGSIMLITDLKEKLDFAITLSELIEHPTIEELAAMMAEGEGKEKVSYAVGDRYPLIPNQMGFVYKMQGNTTANLPYFFKLHDSVDLDRLENAIRKLFEVHIVFKNRIEKAEDGVYYNFRDDSREAQIERKTLGAEEWETFRKGLLRPYNYQHDENLYHIGLYQAPDGKYLFFDVAHVIGDGETMRILFDDLNKLYLDLPVKKSDYTFYEYITDAVAREGAGVRDKDIAFYKEALDGFEISRSVLAKMDSYDLGTAHNASLRGRFSRMDWKSIQGFCETQGITENALFLTAFSYTARLFAGIDDLAITSIHNGRTDGRWMRLMGVLYVRYLVRNQRIPHETTLDLLKRNAGQILQTMKCYTSIMPADEMFVQYQGNLLQIPQIGGETVEPVRFQLDSLPFHLMIYSGKNGYTYELRYWENRFDRQMLEVFMEAMEDVVIAMPDEPSARKLKDHLSVSLYPKHVSIDAARLNAALGKEVIPAPESGLTVKPYILDEYGKKKPFGAWGQLYILDTEVNGNGKSIQSLYTPGVLHDTGLEARITPDGKVEALYQAGRMVKLETNVGRVYLNLFEVEQTLKKYPGVGDASVSVVYGDDNQFHIKAVLDVSGDYPAESDVQAFISARLGKMASPDIIRYR